MQLHLVQPIVISNDMIAPMDTATDPRKTLEEIRAEHVPSFQRRRGGCAAISGRPLFNWHVSCACGWKDTTNLPKREQERSWRDHTRDVWKQQNQPASPAQSTRSPKL